MGTACREIIHERVKKLRAKENQRLSNIVYHMDDQAERSDDWEEELVE